MRLKDKVVVVTGGGSGIGRELVLALLARGARVAALDLRKEGLDETASIAGAGERLSLHVASVSDREAIAALPEAVVAHHGCVDGIINNAGVIQPFTPFAELSYEVIDRMVQVNLYGVIHMVKAFLPLLSARPEAHIVNVASMGGFIPFPGQSMYGASKAGVKLLSEALYAELRGSTVSVSVVMPGAVNTAITKNSGVSTPGGADAEGGALKPLAPEAAARIILDGIEAGKLHILVGRDAQLLFALHRIAPKGTIHLIEKQLRSTREG